MKLLRAIADRPVTWILRAACGASIVALLMMILAVLVPKPIPIILAMSLAHVIGIGGFLLYILGVTTHTVWGSDEERQSRASGVPDGAEGEER